jgi:Spy/CpxP family protein refolding chaperone
MKSVKVMISVLTLCVMAFVTTVSAQEKKGKGMQTPEQRIARIEEAVGTLTADQKTKITAILEKAGKEVAALSQEDRAKGREIQMAANKDIRALLTPEQQTKFDAMPQGGKKKKQN